ncbi:MAG: hypothetical protein HKN12_07200 [Gemmatimonadetes bacterium]|nr:hypothetical protein [Gemmatimonadota bacterium]
MSGDLADGLRKIAARRAERRIGMATPPARASSRPSGGSRFAESADVAAIPHGRYEDIGGVRVFSIRRGAEDLFPRIDLGGNLGRAFRRVAGKTEDDLDRGVQPAAGCRLRDAVILDLETCGFWGCPIFLVGLLYEEDGRLITHQLLARDYPEERAILHAAMHLLQSRRLLVTFNGKSYDVPCFRERAVYHGVPGTVDHLRHVDVLHPARRRFRNELPDCRLQTLEREVVGIYRTGDVPSAEVPDVYHGYAATGRADRIAPVLHHSRVDVLTTASLFAELIPR